MSTDEYDMYLDRLEEKFNEFIVKARKGKRTKTSALTARKESLCIRKDLQEFRQISLDNDKN